jgi:serine/threonine protein kinase
MYHGGTLQYVAPELVLLDESELGTTPPPGSPLCGRAVDCWSLGVTAFELLTGCCLFKVSRDDAPSGMSPDEYKSWEWQRTAELHREWVRAEPPPFLHLLICITHRFVKQTGNGDLFSLLPLC